MPYTKENASNNSYYYDKIGRECSICHEFHSWHYYWPGGNKHALNGKCSECQSCQRKKDAERRWRYRLEALDILGGKCMWPKCAIDDPEMLQIDHKHGNPVQETTQQTIKNIRKGKTWQYQLLCANHHMKKSHASGDFTKRYDAKSGEDFAPMSFPPHPQMGLFD